MVVKNKNSIPEVTCLGIACSSIIEFPPYINPQRYDGDVLCKECSSLMRMKLKDSKVRKFLLILDNSKEETKVMTGIPRPKQG